MTARLLPVRRQPCRPTRRLSPGAGLTVATALAWASPAAAQDETPATEANRYVSDLGTLRDKFEALAAAMPDSTYGWRPMEGVRSVSEVYMLIAAEAYYLPGIWGGDPPEGMTVDNGIFAELAAVTDAPQVRTHLERAFSYAFGAMSSLPPEALEERIEFFGRERTLDDALYILFVDMHEHLGQAIAYARTHRVVPPWSRGG